jgi:Zona pellucida-like domain
MTKFMFGRGLKAVNSAILFSLIELMGKYLAGLPIQVVPEMCWISNTSDFKTSKARKIFLVKKACATDLSVYVEDNFSNRSKNRQGGFNFQVCTYFFAPYSVIKIPFFFQVNRAYSDMSLLYLHCSLGLCTHNTEHARGNLLMVRKLAIKADAATNYFTACVSVRQPSTELL